MPLDSKSLKDLFSQPKEEEPDFFEGTEKDTIEKNEEPEYDGDEDSNFPAPNVRRNLNAKPLDPQYIDSDIDYALRTSADMIEQSQKLVQMSLDNVASNGSPRDTEVAAGAINTAVNAVEKLLVLHEKIQKLKNAQGLTGNGGNVFVQNQNVFTGTTEEALKALKDGKLKYDEV